MGRFIREDQAQGMAEYALIISVIALFLIITAVFFKDQIGNYFSNIGNHLT